MSKSVLFNLGPTVGLATRQLVITRMPDADNDAYAAEHSADAGTNETVAVTLPDDIIWQAVLTDTRTSGEVSVPQVLNFHTGAILFPGPKTTESNFGILAMEDLSSSSSSSSSNSSSSSSSVTSSSSSSSVTSSSSSSS